MPLRPSHLRRFRALAMEQAGLNISPDKEELVSSRVLRHMQQLGIEDPSAYLELLEDPAQIALRQGFINCFTTNFTQFFRELEHFKRLAAHLRRLPVTRAPRIWCAASSTGEEPWSLAIIAHEALGEGRDLRILATDIDTEALKTARRGHYLRAAQQVPRRLLDRHFVRDGEGWRVGEHLRASVRFGRLNLDAPPYPMRGPFDAIFCRNVMIYFNSATQRKIIGEVERLLRADGLFFVGNSEGIQGLSDRLQTAGPSVYRLAASSRRAA